MVIAVASRSPSSDPRPSAVRRGTRKAPRRTQDVDEKDFLDMLMTEVNEEEAAEVLGEAAEEDLWTGPEDEPHETRPE